MVAAARPVKKFPAIVIALLLIVIIAIVARQVGLLRQEEETPAFPYGEIRIAIDPSYAPFATYTENGLQGLDVDLGLALSEQLHLPVRFVPMGIDGLYDSLINDQADIIISALVVDTWRLHEVRYSRPYFDAGLVLVSPSSAPIPQMEDLPGRSLAYEFGSAADSEARRWLRLTGNFVTQPYELPEYALDAVQLGVADAALVDMVDARLYLRQHPEAALEFHYATHLPYVIAARIDRKNTLRQINETLRTLLQNGAIETMLNRWLG